AASVGTAVAAAGGGVLVVIGVVICAVAFPAFLRYTVRSAVERGAKG
ncbi:MFS transporter, partial [Dietzia sp. E1]|nr:MFS transporter [Dietzia sp. E1]